MSKNRKKSNAVNNIKTLLGDLPEDHCVFCRRNDDNEECYGKKIQSGLTVHYFCMLFASGLSQRGQTDDQGIYGFLPEDIIKEIRRGSRLRCSYCKEKGATVGCVVSKCRHVFHFGCGLQHNTMHQYFDTFSSFCGEHRLVQRIPKEERSHGSDDGSTECAICMMTVEMIPSVETLRSPCCRKTWFHRDCIKRYALTAGLYFFKCPLCNNKDQFQAEMLKHGIYIPDQDAAWELEPNAFNELLERYLHCDAKVCRCDHEDGRDYNKDGGRWEILVCDWCGSKGSHVSCHGLIRVSKEDYVCQDCMDIHNKCVPSGKKQKKLKSLKTLPSPRADKKTNMKDKSKSQYSAEKSNRFRKSTETTYHSHQSSPFTSPLNMKKISPFGNSSSVKSPPSCTSTSPSSSVENKNTVKLSKDNSPVAKSRLDFQSPNSENDVVSSSRQIRWKKRKRKESQKVRKSLNLEIDMAWSDPDTSASEEENAPKRLRKRRSSFAPIYVKSSDTKKKVTEKERRIPVISPVNDTDVVLRTVPSDEDPPDLSPQYPYLGKPFSFEPDTQAKDEEETSPTNDVLNFDKENTCTIPNDKNLTKSKSAQKSKTESSSYTALKPKLDYNLVALKCPFQVSVSVERMPLFNNTEKQMYESLDSDSDSDFTLAELGRKMSLGTTKCVVSTSTPNELGKKLSVGTAVSVGISTPVDYVKKLSSVTALNDRTSTPVEHAKKLSMGTALNDRTSTPVELREKLSLGTALNDRTSTPVEFGEKLSIGTALNGGTSTPAQIKENLFTGKVMNDSTNTLEEFGKKLTLGTSKNVDTHSVEDNRNEQNVSYDEFLKEVLSTKKDNGKRVKRRNRKRALPGQTSITQWFQVNKANKHSDSDSFDSNEENRSPSSGVLSVSQRDKSEVSNTDVLPNREGSNSIEVAKNERSEFSNIKMPLAESDKNKCEITAGGKPEMNGTNRKSEISSSNETCDRQLKSHESLTLQASNAVSKSKVLRILRRGKSYTIRRTVLKGSTFKENIDRQVTDCDNLNIRKALVPNTRPEKLDNSEQKSCMLNVRPEEKENRSTISPIKHSILKDILSFKQDQSNITKCSSSSVLTHEISKDNITISTDSFSTSISSVGENSTQSVIEVSSEASMLSLNSGKEEARDNRDIRVGHSSTASLELDEDDVIDLFNTSFSSGPRDSMSQCITISTDTETDDETDSVSDEDYDSGDIDNVSSSQYIIRSFCEGEGYQELKIFVPNQAS